MRQKTILLAVALSGCAAAPEDAPPPIPHPTVQQAPVVNRNDRQSLQSRVQPPLGYQRVHAERGTYGDWLRNLPVLPGRPDVRLYDGRKKANQNPHHVVLDVDVGSEDLQQCADAVIRLRAEFLYARPCPDDIRFNFTSGDVARWAEWRDGIRPSVAGNRVTWHRTAEADDGYSNFRAYLDTVFMYAGSASLEQELERVENPAQAEIGDVFIKGGFPGHAVLVIDVAQNDAGERALLLAQSYMPAQDIHVLRSFDSINPWYHARAEGVLQTPEWEFRFDQLRRFRATACESSAVGRTSD